MGIKEARKAKHLTQQQLADALGVNYSVISKYESGKIAPPTDRLAKLAEVLEVPEDELQPDNTSNDAVKRYVHYLSKWPKGPSAFRLVKKQVTDDPGFMDGMRDVYKAFKRADGKCELCGNSAPFLDKDGEPYLEIHFEKPLKEGADRSLGPCFAVCPNCHRKLTNNPSPEDGMKLLAVLRK